MTSKDWRPLAARAWLTNDALARVNEVWAAAAAGSGLVIPTTGSIRVIESLDQMPLILSEEVLLTMPTPDVRAWTATFGAFTNECVVFIGYGTGAEVHAAERAGAVPLVIEADVDRIPASFRGRRANGSGEAARLVEAGASDANGDRAIVWIANAVAAIPDLVRTEFAPAAVVNLAGDALIPNGCPPRAAEILARVNPLEHARARLSSRADLSRAILSWDERGVTPITVSRAERRGGRALSGAPADEAWLARVIDASGRAFDSQAINAAVADRTLAAPVAIARVRARYSPVTTALDVLRGAVYADARGGSVIVADGTADATARIKHWTSDNC